MAFNENVGWMDDIFDMPEKDAISKIIAMKKSYGEKVVILGHHYQRNEIINLSDFIGDSLELSRVASMQEKASYIVFCGVHFMAESAAILCRSDQSVILPEKSAGCPMADMATLRQVESVWKEIIAVKGIDSVIPITYMNSSADIKAFCGEHGGAICTSSNAKAVVQWALNQNKDVLFMPDEHLGRNTSNALGIDRDKVIVWDPKNTLGGITKESVKKANIILWKGYCHVHTHFSVDHVKQMREEHPDAKIIVHPECKEEVVNMADAAGSTGFIVKYVREAPAGSTIIIGTEINLISRLADAYPDKKILELDRSLCPNMFKINPYNLYYTMLNLGEVNVVKVSDEVKEKARTALRRMLEIL